jgi:hypothetical protein
MTIYTEAGMGMTMLGPEGVLISLGIGLIVTNLQMVTALYNYWSIITIMIIGASAGQFDSKYINLLMPLWAGFCMLAGWLKYPDQGVGFGILVVCAMLAIMIYMVEKRHERFGIAGPGNMIVKIFTFLIVLQCVVVFFNASAIFPSDVPNLAASNNQYANIDLSSQITQVSSTGGLTATIMNVASITLQIAVSALLLMLKCLVSIALFAVVLAQVFPWIVQAGAIGAAFLIVIQFAIWTMYVLFVFYAFYRPGPDPGW